MITFIFQVAKHLKLDEPGTYRYRRPLEEKSFLFEKRLSTVEEVERIVETYKAGPLHKFSLHNIYHPWVSWISFLLFFVYFTKNKVDTCPVMGPLVPLLWTSGDVFFVFQNQGWSLACVLPHLPKMASLDSPLVRQILTAWQSRFSLPHKLDLCLSTVSLGGTNVYIYCLTLKFV